MKKKKMVTTEMENKNYLFSVPMYLISEQGCINTARVERTFAQAVTRMSQCKGFFVIYNRDFCYAPRGVKVVELSDTMMIAFGVRHQIADVKDKFIKNLNLYAKLLRLEDCGYKEAAYSPRCKDFVGLQPKDLVLSETVMNNIIAKKQGFGHMQIAYSLVAKAIDEKNNIASEEMTISDCCSKELLYKKNLIGMEITEIKHYNNGFCAEGESYNLYYPDLIKSRIWVNNFFADNKSVQRMLLNCKDSSFLVTADKKVIRLPEEIIIMGKNSPKDWAR